MKKKIYTSDYLNDLMVNINNPSSQLTSEQDSYIVENQYAEHYNSREELFSWYLSESYFKLHSLAWLIDYLNKNSYFNIISFGAGCSVFESFLRQSLPKQANVITTDYNKYYVDQANKLIPELICFQFDFFNDVTANIKKKINFDVDVAIFPSSSYVMDDDDFIKLFSSLKSLGIKTVLDLRPDIPNNRSIPILIKSLKRKLNLQKSKLKKTKFLRKIMGKAPFIESFRYQRFNGYKRNAKDYSILYNKAGLIIEDEIWIKYSKTHYPHNIAILKFK